MKENEQPHTEDPPATYILARCVQAGIGLLLALSIYQAVDKQQEVKTQAIPLPTSQTLKDSN